MLALYQRCEAFNLRPSDELGLQPGSFLAWQFNNAVWLFGATVMSRYNQGDQKGRRKMSLEQAMNMPPAASKAKPMSRGRLEALMRLGF